MFNRKKKENRVDGWVENEIRLALSEGSPKDAKEDKYIQMCYESAKKAYYALLGQGHSGMSISLTKFILNRLIDRKPLTAITAEDFNGLQPLHRFSKNTKIKELYQCLRKTSLFKQVMVDGSVRYTDNDRVETIDRNGATCFSGKVTEMIDELYPLELPYWPAKPYKVYTAEFTYDKDSKAVSIDPGFYNAMYISHLITPEGDKVLLDLWYFEEEVERDPSGMVKLKSKLKEALTACGLTTSLLEI